MEGALADDAVRRIASGLLTDPVTETATIHWNIKDASHAPAGAVSVEVHPQAGVMDPAAQSVRDAIFDLVGVRTDVATCSRFDLHGVTADQARAFAGSALANPVIQDITIGAWFPSELPKGHEYTLVKRTVKLRGLTDEQLTKLSREAHLFLSLTEMKAVQAEYDRQNRDPSDIELETIAQTWSEHCVHKTLKSERQVHRAEERTANRSTGSRRPPPLRPSPATHANADGTVTIDNLLKRTVAAATTSSSTTASTGPSRSSRTTPAWLPSTTYGASTSRSRPTTARALSSPTAARRRASAAASATSWAPASPRSRSPATDVFCVALPDPGPTDPPGAPAPPQGAPPAPRPARSRRRRARLRQPHGHPHRQRRRPL